MRPIIWKEQDTYISGFLLKEEANLLYICSNVHGRWLQKLEKEWNVEDVACSVLFKESAEMSFLQYPAPLDDTWVFDFALTTADFPYLQAISRFFDIYLGADAPNVQKLEQALVYAMPFLTQNNLLVRLVRFVLNQQFEPLERIHMQVPYSLQSVFSKGETLC